MDKGGEGSGSGNSSPSPGVKKLAKGNSLAFKKSFFQDDLVKASEEATRSRPLLHQLAEGDKVQELIAMLTNADDVQDVNQRDLEGCTPLHLACAEGNVHVLRILLRHPNISVMATDEDGNTPFHLVCQEDNDQLAVAEMLKDPRVDVTRKNRASKTPLQLASVEGEMDAIKWIISGRALKTGWFSEIAQARKEAHKYENDLLVDLFEEFAVDHAGTKEKIERDLGIDGECPPPLLCDVVRDKGSFFCVVESYWHTELVTTLPKYRDHLRCVVDLQQELKLGNVFVPLFQPLVFRTFSSLDFLDLWNAGLSVFPQSLAKFTTLTCLTLRGNKISLLPRFILDFRDLKTLDLSENAFTIFFNMEPGVEAESPPQDEGIGEAAPSFRFRRNPHSFVLA